MARPTAIRPAHLHEIATVREVASFLRLNVKTVYAAISAGTFPAVKVGRSVRVPRAGLLAALDGQRWKGDNKRR